MPEVALRVEKKAGLPFRVRDCKFKGANVKWSPTELAPPAGVKQNGVYMDGGECQIDGCAVDDRLELPRVVRDGLPVFALPLGALLGLELPQLDHCDASLLLLEQTLPQSFEIWFTVIVDKL